MKKVLLTNLALITLVSLLTLSSQAVTQDRLERGYISVNTNANTEAMPDVAEIAFAVTTTDMKSIQKATVINKEISDKLYTLLREMITPANGDYIKTTNFNASPLYTYNGNKKNLEKYEVSNKVIVHTKNLEKIGTMIDKAIDAGATNVDSLTFSISNYDAQCNDLINIATKKAIQRANIVAKTTVSTLDGIKNIDISCNANNFNTPRVYLAKNMLSSVADEASPSPAISISGGVIKINANVNAQFFVK